MIGLNGDLGGLVSRGASASNSEAGSHETEALLEAGSCARSAASASMIRPITSKYGPNRLVGGVVGCVDDEAASLVSSLTGVTAAPFFPGEALAGELLLLAGRALPGEAAGLRFGDLRGLGEGMCVSWRRPRKLVGV